MAFHFVATFQSPCSIFQGFHLRQKSYVSEYLGHVSEYFGKIPLAPSTGVSNEKDTFKKQKKN